MWASLLTSQLSLRNRGRNRVPGRLYHSSSQAPAWSVPVVRAAPAPLPLCAAQLPGDRSERIQNGSIGRDIGGSLAVLLRNSSDREAAWLAERSRLSPLG
jgi:hypothetical protein